MGNQLSVDNYLELLRRSGLVPTNRLQQVLKEIEQQTGSIPSDVSLLSELLIEGKLLTSWHHKMILKGLWRGFFLGRYKLLRELGTGGMSSVYLAEHTLLRRMVAIKVLHQKRASNRSNLVRFYRESRATAVLDHPHIVRVFDFDSDGKFHYLVMEYVEGNNLQDLVDNHGQLPPEAVASYIGQAANGLTYAHMQGLIHRDIKPANLLVTAKGVVKITDLGLARLNNSKGPSLTMDDGSVLGTVDYLAPEQALDSHNVEARVDLYSLGCTMYFLLTGTPPFPAGTMAVRLMKHQTEEPRAISNFRNDVPQVLQEICSRMMRKKVADRPTANEIYEELQGWMTSQGYHPPAKDGSSMSLNSNVLAQDTMTQKQASISTISLDEIEAQAKKRIQAESNAASSSANSPNASSPSTGQQNATKNNVDSNRPAHGRSGKPVTQAAPSSINRANSPPQPSSSISKDKIAVTCDKCSTMLFAQTSHAGKKARCPSCGEILTVPEAPKNHV